MPDAAEADPLGYSFFVLSVLVEDWFRTEPQFVRFFAELTKDFRIGTTNPIPLPSDLREECARATEIRDKIRTRIQEHSTAITLYGDRQGLDVTHFIRFMRAVEDRCSFRDVDEQQTLDCFERMYVRHLSSRPGGEPSLPDHLKAAQKRAYLAVLKDGPIPGKNLAKSLQVELSTLKRHILPPLRPLGLKNSRARGGYYIER